VSFFTKIEQLCASLIERAFAKTFPSDLEPAQIARKLVSTMQAQTREDEGELRAPGFYVVCVSPADFERLREHQAYLERAWATLLRDLASKVGVFFEEGEARVVMTARPSVPLGAIEIEAGSPPGEPKRFRLVTVEGVPPGAVFPLEGTSRVGRSDASEIVLNDPSVSRTHAVIELSGEQARLRDLGSTNGTFLNGRRVETERLQDGDELRFGNTRMRFEVQ
jgi:hypothetical protein